MISAASVKAVLACCVLLFLGRSLCDTALDGPFLYFEEINGVSKWNLYPYLWEETLLNVTCPGLKDFSVYVSRSKEGLLRNFENHERAWCGWSWFVKHNRQHCLTQISPFGITYVAVGRSKSQGTRDAQCQLSTYRSFNYWLVGQGLAGSALFLLAGRLSSSTPFRLTIGTLSFVMMSMLVVMFIFYRVLPDKRKLGAAAVVMGSSTFGFFKWLFGSWLPSWSQLVHSKLVWGYFVASALAGLTLTYLYDNPANVKVNNILKVGLQLLGLALLGTSTSLPEFSILACGCLVAVHLMMLMMPRVSVATVGANNKVEPQAGYNGVAAYKAPQTPGMASTPVFAQPAGWLTPQLSEQLAGSQLAESSALASEEAPMSPLVKKGFILNEETGRVIQIQKATYNKLVHSGYVVDTVRGVITPPRETRRRTRAGNRSSLAPAVADSP